MHLNHPPLYLASKSPRRQELLKAAGIPFQLIDVDVEETYPDDMVFEDVPEFLARKKATAAIPLVPFDGIVLAADSIVILDNIVFGKPVDASEAVEMLSKLAGRHHLVITGVFLGNHLRGVGFQISLLCGSNLCHLQRSNTMSIHLRHSIRQDHMAFKIGLVGLRYPASKVRMRT